MKVSDVLLGVSSSIEVCTMLEKNFGSSVQVLDEVGLFFSESTGQILLRFGSKTWSVKGRDEDNQNHLLRLVERSLPRIVWVSAVEKDTNEQTIISLFLEIREFPMEHHWSDKVEFGVDEKIVEQLGRKRKDISSIETAISWLSEKVLLPNRNGKQRLLISSDPNPSPRQKSNFRIYGDGIAVDVARNQKDCLLVTRVVEARRPRNLDERRPLVMIHGDFTFVDHTIAGQFRHSSRQLLDQIVQDSGSYLGIWKEYNELERKSILRQAREFGWLSYSKCIQQPDGLWKFFLSDNEKAESGFRFLQDNESVFLEADERPPSELVHVGEKHTGEEPQKRRRRRIFSGECVTNTTRTLLLRVPDSMVEEQVSPPKQGVLFISLGGDRKRLERRRQAQAEIASATCAMPQLGLLIEGKTVSFRRAKTFSPLSEAAREVFGGEPTSRQREALEIALNTPDIALIQGPPGTGKTRTIAALQTRLSEISDEAGQVAGRFLLTSYQHDAVENVASATQVYGLPALKVGKKRGQEEELDGFERWRRERVESVSAQLANSSNKLPVSVAYRQCLNWATSYLYAPSKSEDVGSLLKEIQELSGEFLPSELNDRLLELRQAFRRTSRQSVSLDHESELVLKAVRGIRTTEGQFSDDGYLQAYKALRSLQSLDVLADEERVLLQKAADWDSEDCPDFLTELDALKESLLDRLLPEQTPIAIPSVNTDVEAILGEILNTLRKQVRASVNGVDAILYEFREELENAPQDARETVQQYTVVLAATCQQAVGYQMSTVKGESRAFDTVVVDEAARANPLDLFIPMALAKRRIILVGDHRQLPHILDQEIEHDLESGVNQKTQDMLKKSLFQRLFQTMREREKKDGIKRTITLDVQYRMHPVLGSFVSDTFYKPHGDHEAFESGRHENDFQHSLSRYKGAVAAWVNVPHAHGTEKSGKSKLRTVEARRIAEEALSILKEQPELSVGVIAFYSAQVNEILKEMEVVGLTEKLENGGYRALEKWRETRDSTTGKRKERLRIGTVDAFQGKEFDVVLLSMTRSNNINARDEKTSRQKYGHLMLENRLCVAMSRQQRLLIVVGDAGMLEGEQAGKAVPGLMKFWELCGGEYGVRV
jgi:hypothetical protein